MGLTEKKVTKATCKDEARLHIGVAQLASPALSGKEVALKRKNASPS